MTPPLAHRALSTCVRSLAVHRVPVVHALVSLLIGHLWSLYFQVLLKQNIWAALGTRGKAPVAAGDLVALSEVPLRDDCCRQGCPRGAPAASGRSPAVGWPLVHPVQGTGTHSWEASAASGSYRPDEAAQPPASCEGAPPPPCRCHPRPGRSQDAASPAPLRARPAHTRCGHRMCALGA
ncbi:Hypothetical predicted protein [Marmota monax]|uniref:Uncharacterized protein n=1 Tax=Marmota monax TaxID=9995 RepID=A0A5E4A2E0_MARMO|nr:Hypothetical predicted protein [Marmota monax]